jgi:predicted PurR-regulated permease PerM
VENHEGATACRQPEEDVEVRSLERKAFLVLIGVTTLAFGWILWPFFGAVFWAAVIAIVFAPVFRRALGWLGGARNMAALATVVVILLIVIIPVLFIAAALVQEATSLYGRIQSGEIDVVRLFQPVFDALPGWVTRLLRRFGIADLGAVRDRIATGLTGGIQAIATQALSIGQSTFSFIVSLGVMLYLLFFLLRDGEVLARGLKRAIPISPVQQDALFEKFTLVIRATVKGDLFVAMLQGAAGGLVFAFLGVHAALLWAVLMAVFSLLPAIGAALVWLPVALYFLATGATWEGVLLIAYGLLVIGLVDNLLRPLMVGQATKMPDYVVLISTLGGIETFGLHGFIIGPVIAATFLSVWATFSAASSPAPAPRA